MKMLCRYSTQIDFVGLTDRCGSAKPGHDGFYNLGASEETIRPKCSSRAEEGPQDAKRIYEEAESGGARGEPRHKLHHSERTGAPER